MPRKDKHLIINKQIKQMSRQKTSGNPAEALYPQVQRMQNLLEEYDRENQFLNQQVLHLLYHKSHLGGRSTQQGIKTNRDEIVEGVRDGSTQRTGQSRGESSRGGRAERTERVERERQVKESRDGKVENETPVRFRDSVAKIYDRYQKTTDLSPSLNTRDDSCKKRYQYINRQISPYEQMSQKRKQDLKIQRSTLKQSHRQQPHRFRYYTQQQQQSSANTNSIKKYETKKQQKKQQKQVKNGHNYLSETSGKYSSRSPVVQVSRLLADGGLQKISQSGELKNDSEDLGGTQNMMMPFIQRSVYTRSPDLRSQFPLSPSRNYSPSPEKPGAHNSNSPSRISVKSNKSNKSGIEVTTSQRKEVVDSKIEVAGGIRPMIELGKFCNTKTGTNSDIKNGKSTISITQPSSELKKQLSDIKQKQTDIRQKVKQKSDHDKEIEKEKGDVDKNYSVEKHVRNGSTSKKMGMARQYSFHEEPSSKKQIPDTKLKIKQQLSSSSKNLTKNDSTQNPKPTPSITRLYSIPILVQSFHRSPSTTLLHLSQEPSNNHISSNNNSISNININPNLYSHPVPNFISSNTNINSTQNLNLREGNMMRQRSMSQHRIEPSEKINYQGSSEFLKSTSKKDIRGKSIDGKKKFIAIVSATKLADRKEFFVGK